MNNKISITEAFINEYIKNSHKSIKIENSNISINKLADFIKKSVDELIKSQEGCSEYKLDDNLSVFVGWSDGYSSEHDDTIIQANEDPTFAINVGIKSNHDYLKTDYDWLNYPYDAETGEVWDSGIAVSPNEDYSSIAKWLLDEYASMKKAIADNKLIVEARSHKEDNEKAAPRTKLNKNGREVKTRNMVDVSNPKVGNNSYHNEKGHQYWGTTSSEYASKRNKTGEKNEFGYDLYLADYDDMRNPVRDFQSIKNDIKSLEDDRDYYDKKSKRARSQGNYEYYTRQKEYLDSEIDKYNQRATDIVNKEKERIANKTQTNEALDTDNKTENISIEIFNDITNLIESNVLRKALDKYNAKSGNILPEQELQAEDLIHKLAKLYADVVKQNM